MGLLSFKRGNLEVGRGYREVASIDLPGVTPLESVANMEDIKCKRYGKQYGFVPGAMYDVTKR